MMDLEKSILASAPEPERGMSVLELGQILNSNRCFSLNLRKRRHTFDFCTTTKINFYFRNIIQNFQCEWIILPLKHNNFIYTSQRTQLIAHAHIAQPQKLLLCSLLFYVHFSRSATTSGGGVSGHFPMWWGGSMNNDPHPQWLGTFSTLHTPILYVYLYIVEWAK